METYMWSLHGRGLVQRLRVMIDEFPGVEGAATIRRLSL